MQHDEHILLAPSSRLTGRSPTGVDLLLSHLALAAPTATQDDYDAGGIP